MKIKQNIHKLVNIALSTIGTETYLEALTSDDDTYLTWFEEQNEYKLMSDFITN